MSELGVNIARLSVAATLALGLGACGSSTPESQPEHPDKLSRPIESHHTKSGKLIHEVHTQRRDELQLQRVVDYCLNGSYYRVDPLFNSYYELDANNAMFIKGLAGEEACANDSIDNSDPEVPIPPADYGEYYNPGTER